MQERMAETQTELASRSIECSTSGGRIKVTATGAGDITAIKIDPAIVDPQDVELLEDMILTGVRQALEEARQVAGDEMGKLTGGLKIPGLSL